MIEAVELLGQRIVEGEVVGEAASRVPADFREPEER